MMSKLINLINKKFGKLLVIRRVSNNQQYRDAYWLCKCDCGQEISVRGPDLRQCHTKSCGCLVTKHGHKSRKKTSKIYAAWNQMIQRCKNPNHNNYQNYGGRDITVCERWLKFENFLVDMGESPTNKYSLDRIDNDGNYCPENCRWATKKQQARNRSDNHSITYNGITLCLAAWAEELDIKYHNIYNRLRRGWSIDRTLTEKIGQQGGVK